MLLKFLHSYEWLRYCDNTCITGTNPKFWQNLVTKIENKVNIFTVTRFLITFNMKYDIRIFKMNKEYVLWRPNIPFNNNNSLCELFLRKTKILLFRVPELRQLQQGLSGTKMKLLWSRLNPCLVTRRMRRKEADEVFRT